VGIFDPTDPLVLLGKGAPSEGAGVWRGLGLETGRRFRAVFMKIPGDHPVPFLDIIQFLDPPTAGEPYPTLHNIGIAPLLRGR
jgi:hypothetical protein